MQNEINRKLADKGYTVTSDTPDFHISAHLRKEVKTKTSDSGVSPTANQVAKLQYLEGSLVLVFSDVDSGKPIWWGTAKTKFDNYDTPEKKKEIAVQAIVKIVKKFPPKP